MSKIKKRKQKKISSTGRSVSTVFKIPLPEELNLPMLDKTSLRVITVGATQLKAQVIQLRNAASSRQKMDIIPVSIAKTFATIATNTWRAKVKMVDSGTGEAKEEMKRVYRHIEAIDESLKQIGVETIDPVGRAYDSGMALKVVTFEPTPGLSNEEIKETIKPSVAWQGRLIQIGEVIVGTPQTI